MIRRLTAALDFQSQALVLRAERQRVIAGNIANAETPGYQARDFDFASALRAASGESRTGEGIAGDKDALPIRADARVLATTLKAGESAEYESGNARHLYLVPAAGSVEVNGVRVNARDGAAIRDEAKLTITALEDTELVLVDAA